MRIVNLKDPSYHHPSKPAAIQERSSLAEQGGVGYTSMQKGEEITMHNNPVALVTGANKGIGLQIAKDLAARGFTVLVASRKLEHGVTAARSVGADARALELDVTDQASIAAAAERIRTELGRLDVLVNNAGVSHAGKPGRPLQEIAKSGRPSVASLDE